MSGASRYWLTPLVIILVLVGSMLGALFVIPYLAPALEAPQAQGQVPKTEGGRVWEMIPMSGGPAVYTACVKGIRLYAMNQRAWREGSGLEPGAALAAVAVPCGRGK